MGHPQIKAKASSELESLEALVELAKSGDEEALSTLIRITQDRLYKFCLFLAADRELASDVLQDTYIYAFEHLREIRQPDRFSHWLFTIARHKFYDQMKSTKNRQLKHRIFGMEQSHFLAPKHGLHIEVEAVFCKLSAEERMILVLIDGEGYSYKEASDIIGISENATRSRLHRARLSFVELYKKD